MYQLLNGPHEEGDYIFCGTAFPSAKVQSELDSKDLSGIIKQIHSYTSIKPRPKTLIFADTETGTKIYVEDNLSLTDLKSEEFQKFSREKIKAHCLNIYTLTFEGQLPM